MSFVSARLVERVREVSKRDGGSGPLRVSTYMAALDILEVVREECRVEDVFTDAQIRDYIRRTAEMPPLDLPR